MHHLPFYIPLVFILTTLITLAMLFKAANFSKPVIVVALLWLALQAGVGLSGFYTKTDTIPPRFALLLLPPVIFIAIVLLIKSRQYLLDGFNVKTLTLLHIIRIPVELTLYWLFLHKAVPQVITFEGRNFDIICGLTAPLIYYFGYVRNAISRGILIAWNVICLLILANVVVTAVLSAPFQFQQLGFGQPNIAMFYFPFLWLPCFLVPVVIFAHLVALRRLFFPPDARGAGDDK